MSAISHRVDGDTSTASRRPARVTVDQRGTGNPRPRETNGCRNYVTDLRNSTIVTVYAVSANTRRFWELPVASELAYTPIDNAETHASHLTDADAPTDPEAPQAGPYALPEFTLKHIRP
ncbi:hypothetical protein ACFYO2_40120 [Streptomyces sp. NPDC006602]|uniref:hypothetical protein n=1 Tax=Streptomyces sp. NPDC006602 TaxID=3364751 RepID=UPI0036802B86